MEGPAPMMRLLQGDVGSGKTAVAMLALLAAAGSGWQGAFMVPTEVIPLPVHLSTVVTVVMVVTVVIVVMVGTVVRTVVVVIVVTSGRLRVCLAVCLSVHILVDHAFCLPGQTRTAPFTDLAQAVVTPAIILTSTTAAVVPLMRGDMCAWLPACNERLKHQP